MPEFSDNVIQVFRWKRGATEQGGLLSGKDPSEFNSADPLRLWIIQIGVIVATASLLSLGLRKIRQPKVIAEVLGGIILGPTAFGSIPGFTEHIFPQESRPFLSLTANIGLCLFLFLVGLEIDAGVIQRNARLSATVALAGMVIPFGIGAGLSKAIYDQFIDESVKFTNFMLFAGVAFSITAFPVLCRILTELKLLDTTVGIVVLSAGVGNDIIGWTLLALSVALVNAGSGLTALYILLCCVGYTLFLLFPGKYALKWLARETGSLESGPTVLFMTVTMLVLFGSAFFTDIIGVHAIFGAFVTGIIVPREGGLAIALTEKLEDMVAIIFLPLYFTLSGLSTNLQLLDDGITWGYTIAIIFTAFIGKFGGCCLAARYAAGFNWRESGAIGSLMSCKGLVELIVLNVGLSAGILTQRVFSMFVLEALVLTFMTTPLVLQFYPPHVRKRVTTTGPTFDHVSDGEEDAKPRLPGDDSATKRRFTVVLDKLEHLPGVMALSQLIQPAYHTPTSHPQATSMGRAPSQSSTSKHRLSSATTPRLTPPTSVEALRLIELSDRTSAVMRSSASDALLRTDPVMAIYRMFGQLNCLPIIPRVAIVPYDDLSYTVAEHAKNHGSDLILLPWLPPHLEQGVGNEASILSPASGVIQFPDVLSPTSHIVSPASHNAKSPTNPFEMLFRTAGAGSSNANQAKSPAVIHSQFVRGVFSEAGKHTNVALFVDQSPPSVSGMMSMVGTGPQHVFLPFFGGPDDRLALEFVVQMCENNEKLRATVARMVKREVTVTEPSSGDNGLLRPPAPARTASDGKLKVPGVREDINVMSAQSTFSGFPDTVYGHQNTETRMMSETADNIAWAKYASPPADSPTSPALSRIRFHELVSPVPLHAAIQEASSACYDNGLGEGEGEAGWAPQGLGDRLVIVTGRSRRLAVENHTTELKDLMDEYGTVGSTVKKTIGDVATAFVVAGVGTGVVVVQAATSA